MNFETKLIATLGKAEIYVRIYENGNYRYDVKIDGEIVSNLRVDMSEAIQVACEKQGLIEWVEGL